MIIRLVLFGMLWLPIARLYAQNILRQSAFSAAGNAASINTTQRLYAVVGQPIVFQKINTPPSFAGVQAGFMQVTSYSLEDEVSPIIQYLTSTQIINKQSPPTLTSTITDNINVNSAKIHYRKITEAVWSSTDMSKSENTYSATVLTSWFDAMGVEYYLEAKDANGNTARQPITGSYFAYVTSASETIPSNRIGFGISTTNYKIIAMPYTTSNNSVTSLFEELGTFSNTKWRMATYNNASDSFQEYPAFSSLSRGVGYWILVKTPVDMAIGSVESFAENRASLYSMILKPGWNMIGNPYPVTISWSDVRTLNNKPEVSEIKVYNSGWDNGNTLAAYEGGFVFVNGTSDVSIKIPFVGQTEEGGRTKNEFSNDLSSDAWLVTLRVSQNDVSNALGGFGMHTNGSPQVDQYDDYNPPGFLNSPRINFPHPEHWLENFSRDILPTAPDATWSFTVEGNPGESTVLNWNNDLGNSSKELFLLDEVNLKLISFHDVDHYEFKLEEAHSFSIYFGENIKEKIKPKNIAFAAPYPNPVAKEIVPVFTLALPEASSTYSVNIDLVNASGMSIATDRLTISSGIHELKVDNTKHSLSSGVYYYRVRVYSKETQKIFTGKLIVL